MVIKHDLKVEDQLLLLCSITETSNKEEKLIKQILNSNLDWDYLIETAHQNRLGPLLHWQLNRIDSNAIPPRFKESLKEHFHANVLKNLSMFKELISAVDLLQKNGITPIPYKGPVLAIMTYGNLGFREFSDLDLYVPLDHVQYAQEILIENGYKSLMKLTPNQERSFHNFQREYHFINKTSGITLEIKWRFLSRLHSIKNEPFCDIPNFLREVQLDQFKIKTISPEPLILILAIHNAGHSFSSLYRFCDLSELIKSEDNINWQNLMEMSEQIRVKRIFLANLYILNNLFQIKLPKIIIEAVNQDKEVSKIALTIINQLFSPKSKGVFGKVSFNMHLREKNVDKFKVMIGMMLTPTPGLIEKISLPSFLEPLYYIFRLFQMLKNIVIDK